jgi:hypothetical protein
VADVNTVLAVLEVARLVLAIPVAFSATLATLLWIGRHDRKPSPATPAPPVRALDTER